MLAEVVEIEGEGLAGVDGCLGGAKGEGEGAVFLLDGMRAPADGDDGGFPEGALEGEARGSRERNDGAGRAGVEEEGDGAEAVVGEGEIEVAVGVVEGDDAGGGGLGGDVEG